MLAFVAETGIIPVIPCSIRELPTEPGVYWLLALRDPLNGDRIVRPRPIARLLGTDTYGILYIGSTPDEKGPGSLQQRAGKQLAAPLATLQPDDLWERLNRRKLFFDYLYTPGLLDTIPRNHLAIAFETTGTQGQAARLEQRLYYNYRQKHGERPPFNRGFDISIYEKECPNGWKKHRGVLPMEDARHAPDFLTLEAA